MELSKNRKETYFNLPVVREEDMPKGEVLNKYETDEFDVEVIETKKSEEFVWIRIYLSTEAEISKGDIIEFQYLPKTEKIDLIFSAYEKKGLHKDSEEHADVMNYIEEEDTKILCVMVSMTQIHKREDIPFIRTLFKGSRYYQNQLLRKTEMKFINQKNKKELDFFTVAF